MKQQDLGINPKAGVHDTRLTTAENRFLAILWTDHVGPENKIGANELAVRFQYALMGADPGNDCIINEVIKARQEYPAKLSQWKRDVRAMQNHLLTRHDNIPIFSAAGIGGGYWIAASEAEANDFYETFRRRGLTGMIKASRGKKAALVDMFQQLTFEFDELTDATGLPGPVNRRESASAPIAVVDAFMAKMSADPEKFADGLRKIGRKYGSVLMPKSQVAALKAKTAELQELLGMMNAE